MNSRTPIKTALALAAFALVSHAQSAPLAKADYSNTKTRIGAEYKVDKAACDSLAQNAKDVCIEEAKAKEKVALAELEYAHSNKAKDANKVLVAKAESSYAVAKERCDDKSGNDKDVCVKEAKAVEVKALADAKVGKVMGEARKDAAEDKRDANYKLAMERCESQAGDAKARCLNVAKSEFGKR